MRTDPASMATRANLGARIRSLREERGLSQHAFAEMISMDRGYLGNVENGRRNISIDNLSKIARGFDITLSEMFAGIDSYVYEHIRFP